MSLFGGGKSKAQNADALASLKVQSQGYGNVIPLVFGKVRLPVTLFFYSNFKATSVKEKTKSGGKGGMNKKPSNTTYSYSAAVMLGICGNEITTTGKLWVDKEKYTTVTAQGFSVFSGINTQNPWGYLSTYEPTKAVYLRGFSYLAANNYKLSDNATLGNHTVEVFANFGDAFGDDVNPSAFLPWIMREQCGIAFSRIADIADYRDYCDSQDLLFSFALAEQRQASEIIQEFLHLTSSELVYKNGMFHFISYYQAGLSTGYDLTSDDFIVEQGEMAVKPTRKKAIDSYNSLKVEFLNRATDYNIEIAEYKDLASIEDIGLRPAETLKAHGITRAQMARNLASHLLRRDLAIRNTYEFVLSPRYIALEPMDVVTINDAALGLVNHPVIIKQTIITADYQIKVTAEDFVTQIYEATSYPFVEVEPFIPDHTASAGDVNAPVIFAAPAVLTDSGYEIWCAVSSNSSLYGGCDIYLSIDGGTSYSAIGSHAGSTRMGVLTADLVSGDDIDSVHTLAVDLTQSNGVLSAVSQVSVDTLETLCKVGNEFLAYRDATLTAPSEYDLSYLRRGLYASSKGASTGDVFVRCDDTLFKFPYNPLYAGRAIKLKFASYNSYAGGQQDISTLTEYNFTIPGVQWDSGACVWDRGLTFWTS